MVEETKAVSEENAKMTLKMAELMAQNAEVTEEMRQLARQNAQATAHMKESTQQNAKATERMTALMAQNAEVTEEMRQLARQNAQATVHMKESNQQNAKATERMRGLAESNNRQALQGARQAKSMAALAYDSKRDSEVMKTITVVTMIFLPATFVSVRPNFYIELTAGPTTSSRPSSAWDSSISTSVRPVVDSRSLRRGGFTWPARFHSRSSCSCCRLLGCDGLVRSRRCHMITPPRKYSPTPLIVYGLDPGRNLFDENHSIHSKWSVRLLNSS